MRHWLAVTALALVLMPASAATIYSNLGPGNSYDSSGVIVTGQQVTGTEFKEGAGFVSAFDGFVDQIDIALANIGGTNTAVVGLWTDGGAGVPGTPIASWSLSGLPDWNTDPGNTPVTISGIAGVHLSAGTMYYLVAEPLDPTDDSWNAWQKNNTGDMGQQPNFQNGMWNATSNTQQLAFAIYGTPDELVPTPAPEPATLALALGGIAGVWRLRRRSRA